MTASADVVVVGGGVVGCAVAYYAAKRGLRVTLVDQPKRGRATSASAGGLWPLGESLGLGCGVIFHAARVARGEAADGADVGQLPAEFLDFALVSNAMFPRLAADLRGTTGMDVELEASSLLFLVYDDADAAFARRLHDGAAGSRELMEWMTSDDVASAEPAITRELQGALRFVGDDQVNPYRLADVMRAAARRLGASILSHVEVVGMKREGSRVVGVLTSEGVIAGRVVVNAAGAWAAEIGRMAGVEVPVHPVRGQIVATESLPDVFRACLSTSQCYLAQKAHGEVIIGSTTEDVGFDCGVTPTALRTLSQGAVRAVPMLADVRVKRAWSGLRPGTPDELPILGPAVGIEGYLNACGHFRTGILNAPLTGQLIAELASGDAPSHPIGPFLLSRFEAPAR
jgi:hydrogen cyanide synthase HcnC